MRTFSLTEVTTPDAPEAIGPYSQAIVSGGWIYVSGQIPLDPASGEVIFGGVAEQTRRVLRSLSAVLDEAGGGIDTVVRTTVYLSDMTSFGEMNGVYGEFFDSHRPARATVEVARLPRDVLVEIDAIARVRS